MGMQVEFSDAGDYVLATVTGSYDLDEAVDWFGHLIAACRKLGKEKALIDYRTMTGVRGGIEEALYIEGVADLYRIHLSAAGAPLKLAYLAAPSWAESVISGAETAQRIGLDVFLTTELDEALQWLSEG